MTANVPPVFDGHNDVLTKLMRVGGPSVADLFIDGSDNHIDLPKALAGGFGGGFFAIWVPSPPSGVPYQEMMENPPYDVPLPEPVAREDALAIALEQAAILLSLHDRGALRICTRVTEIRDCLARGTIAAIMHMEGADAVDPDFHALDVLYSAGLRSLGLVWSRPNQYGEGVPFRFPGSPDTGRGLTPHGIALVRRCNEKRILVDLSHLNEAGFNDVANISTQPLIASHSNAHTLCRQSRNLTDRQLSVIRESNGLVGLNFATAFLAQDGRMHENVSFDVMLQHLDYLLEHLGEDGVAMGSDFDGAVVPGTIKDVAGLPKLRVAMKNHGYDTALISKLCHENWLRVLQLTWGE